MILLKPVDSNCIVRNALRVSQDQIVVSSEDGNVSIFKYNQQSKEGKQQNDMEMLNDEEEVDLKGGKDKVKKGGFKPF